MPELRRHAARESIAPADWNYKFCCLAEPVTDVPFVPMMMGCESDPIPIDTPVVVVGYGNTSDAGARRSVDAARAGVVSRRRV